MYSPRDQVLTRTRPSIALCQNSQASVWRSTIDEKAPHDARAEPQVLPSGGRARSWSGLAGANDFELGEDTVVGG